MKRLSLLADSYVLKGHQVMFNVRNNLLVPFVNQVIISFKTVSYANHFKMEPLHLRDNEQVSIPRASKTG